MGTSADRDGGSGGAWTSLKLAATSYAKSAGSGGGSDEQVRRLLGRQVAVFGGAGAAGGSAVSGGAALSAMGGFLSAMADVGLAVALRDVGLGHLVGGDRFDVLDELLTLLASDGSDLESQAARDAQCDVLDELFGDAEIWADLDGLTVTETQIETILANFLAHYVYNRIPAIGERLARLMDPAVARRADDRIIEMIRSLVEIHMPSDPLNFDWTGSPGRDFADETITETYRILEAFGDEDL